MPDDLSENRKILIVGAGPVGLAMALELTRHGVPCRIVDKSAGRSSKSKALGVQARTMEVFGIMGVQEAAIQAGHKIFGMSLYAHEKRLARIGFEALESPCPFVLVLPQSETERILGDRSREMGIEVERNVEVTGFSQEAHGVAATLRHADGRLEIFHAPWLIGCDGAHSVVRHTLGLPFEGAPYEEGFILADVKIDWSLPEDELSLFLSEDGVLGFFPMGGGMHRIVASLPVGTEQEAPTIGQIQALVNQRGPRDARVSDPAWLSAFRIQRRMVPRFREGRVFLAGDAAHIHSPAGGQGMNTGIQDAFNLAWKLGLVTSGAAPESLLDSYSAERVPVARKVLRITDSITHGATLHNPVAQRIRNRVIPALARLGFARRRFLKELTEIGVSYPSSPIVGGHWAISGLHPGLPAGSRAPDGLLVDRESGKPVRIFDLLRDGRHALLLFGAPDGFQVLRQIAALVERNPHVSVYSIQGESPVIPGANPLLDRDGSVHLRYHAHSACLYLVRPDGYIGFRGSPPDREALGKWLNLIFQQRAHPVF